MSEVIDLTVHATGVFLGPAKHCQVIGHAWDYTDSTWRSEHGGIPVTLRCQRCDTERRETWSPATGEMMNRRYIHSDAYRKARRTVTGQGKPTKDELRQWALADRNRRHRSA